MTIHAYPDGTTATSSMEVGKTSIVTMRVTSANIRVVGTDDSQMGSVALYLNSAMHTAYLTREAARSLRDQLNDQLGGAA